jgi:hypothetical protein
MKPLNPVPAAIFSVVVVAIIVIVIIPGSGFNELSLARWVHILSGVMWIGLPFYVNVDQLPALAAAAADKGGASGAGITKEDFITVRRGHSDGDMSAFVH